MTTSPSPGATSPSPSSGASPSSLPRWRQFLLGACNTARHLGATLNWRRDPDYEQSIVLHEQRMLQYEQRRIQHEQRMKQLESETEQLRQQNARGRQLLAKIDALCFPPESSSIPQIPTAPDCKPS